MLAQYSFGMALGRGCGLPSVALVLAHWLNEKFDNVRERLRDWYCSAADKSGTRRGELEVAACFGPLLAWVLSFWQGRQLAVALDETTLGERFVVLAISVVYRRCAIPVAWKIVPAHRSGAHAPLWIELLERFRQIVPKDYQVIVLADRGLYARWLYQKIQSLGWHPFLRVNATRASFRPAGSSAFVPLSQLLPKVGRTYQAAGTLFRSTPARLECTLTACWQRGCAEGWFIATDLPPEAATAAWYGLRSWIERGFKHTKTGGWNWQHTRMTDPQRAERLWLVMALADVYLLRCGTQHQALCPPADRRARTPRVAEALPPRTASTATLPRPLRPILSTFRIGLLLAPLLILQNAPRLPETTFHPEPWPNALAAPFHPP